ncbi:TetR/AcrR family transcriptional regulator [Rhodococcus sp. HNM0569]|uniref:TetR family transcriptional regulator n=1 Tax=Rhodococcus sp. HNM0569 TaxID=2716340 RepID=UPI00146C1F17|nr:TetR/AcrR family transcriptional regulator [Rhodococcus sp. HNM0569]
MADARRTPADDRIAAAALHLLRAHGARAVTIEAVAAESGVAKTTIYRRFRNRHELLAAALAPLTRQQPPAPDSSDRERATWIVRSAVAAIDDGIGPGGFASLLIDEDPEFSALFRRILTAHRGRIVDALFAAGHDIDRGLADTVIDAVVGGYISELARASTVGPGWEERMLRVLTTALPSGV